MPPKTRAVPVLTDEQAAKIKAGIARDPDSREASDAQLARMRPAREVLSPGLYAALTRPRGRPRAAETKEPVKLRLDRSAVAAFRQTGPGWMTRISDIVTDAAKSLDRPTPQPDGARPTKRKPVTAARKSRS